MRLTRVDIAALVLVGVALVWQDAHSAELGTWLTVPIASNHTGTDQYTYNGETRRFNEQNIGLGIEHDVDKNMSLGAGVFRNSYYRTTYYAGADVHTYLSKYIRVGVSFALTHGYMDTPVHSIGMILPNVTVIVKRAQAKVGYVPIGQTKVMTFSVGYRFR